METSKNSRNCESTSFNSLGWSLMKLCRESGSQFSALVYVRLDCYCGDELYSLILNDRYLPTINFIPLISQQAHQLSSSGLGSLCGSCRSAEHHCALNTGG
ncbi:hypothetical protein M758_8G000800 [Ceratodon purpureus]|nr:hypothetical protein M758_8G000800 [Ceratodon purpureus]